MTSSKLDEFRDRTYARWKDAGVISKKGFKMADTPEKKVKRKIVALLKEHGAYYFYPVTSGFGASGVPDVIACLHGRFIGIEAKADLKRNKPTALQTKNLNEIENAGGIALVIDANNLDQLAAVLESVEKSA